MSYTIESAAKVHARQVAAVESVQAFLIKAADGVSSARSKAPRAPERLTSVVQKLTAPVAKVVGTPDEVQAYVVASSRDWLDVQHRFRSAVLDAAFPPVTSVEVPSRATAKKKA